MKTNTAIVLASSAFFLAACGGSSTSSSSGASFDSMVTRGEALINKIDGQSITPVRSMPTAGTASYSGVAGFGASIYDEVEVLSEASLTANFGSSSISGNLTNFRDYENTAIPGSVAIQSGVIRGNQFSANLNGSVTTDGGAQAVNGTLDGGFAGASANLVAGVIEGTVGGERVVGVLGAEKK